MDESQDFSDAFLPSCFKNAVTTAHYEISFYETIKTSNPNLVMRLRLSKHDGELIKLHKGQSLSGKELISFYNELKSYFGVPAIYICDDARFENPNLDECLKLQNKIEANEKLLLSLNQQKIDGKIGQKPLNTIAKRISQDKATLSMFFLRIRIYKAFSTGSTYYQQYIPGLKPAVIANWPRVPTPEEPDKKWSITQNQGEYTKALDYLSAFELLELDLFYLKYYHTEIPLSSMFKLAFNEPFSKMRAKAGYTLGQLFNKLTTKLTTLASVAEEKKTYDKTFKALMALDHVMTSEQKPLKGALACETKFLHYVSIIGLTDVYVDHID